MNVVKRLFGLVLAGGQSSRMGQDKAQLLWQEIPLYQHMVGLLDRAGIPQVLVSSNSLVGKEVVTDLIPDKGPLSGIHAALHQLQDGDRLLIIPVDMPLLPISALQELAQQEQPCTYDSYTLPMLLPVTPELRALVDESINSDQHRNYSLWRLHKNLQGVTLELSESMAEAFGNANTPEEWQQCQILGEQKP